MLRLFVAIRVPAEVQRALAAEQRRQEDAGARLRWVRPESIHLTLVFLGNVAEERVPAIERAVQATAAEVAPFDLAVRGLGCFPPHGRPRVLWAGLEGGLDALHALQQGIDRRLRRAGFTLEERAFRPHLTLGRATPQQAPHLGPALQARLSGGPPSIGQWHVRDVEVIRSQLHPTGSIYTTLCSAPLAGDPSPTDTRPLYPKSRAQDALTSGG